MDVGLISWDEEQTFLKPFYHSLVVSPNAFRRAIRAPPLGILLINIKQKISFDKNFDTHSGEHLITGVFPISGNFYSSSFFFRCVSWASVSWTKHSLLANFLWLRIGWYFLSQWGRLVRILSSEIFERSVLWCCFDQNQLPNVSISGKLNVMQIIDVRSFCLNSVIFPLFASVWNLGKTNTINIKLSF